MSPVLETDDQGTLTVPAELLGGVKPHTCYKPSALLLRDERAIEHWHRQPPIQCRRLLVNVATGRARRAANLAATHRLRGADAVCVAITVEYGATLVTWDAEMLQRALAVVPTMTPTEWLATNAAKDHDS